MSELWSPQVSDFRQMFDSANPWHQTGAVPVEWAPPNRRCLGDTLWQELLQLQTRRHLIILGPRRVGKTTAMYQTVQSLIDAGVDSSRLWWLRLDHPLLIDVSLGSLVDQVIESSQATAENPVFLFLDEVTYSDKWDLWLKTFYDEHYPVRIVATSSAIAAMRKQGSESGVGRWDERYLAPYLFTEYLDLVSSRSTPLLGQFASVLGTTLRTTLETKEAAASISRIALETSAEPADFGAADATWLQRHRLRYMAMGGFPELLLRRADALDGTPATILARSQQMLKSDAIDKALYKDLPQTFRVQDPMNLERLLYVLSGQFTGLVDSPRLARDANLSRPTVDKYLGFFERAFLVFLLPNFASTEAAVQRRGRKLFFVDVAVRNAALLRGTQPFSDPGELGLLNENLVGSHLRTLGMQESVRLYHWRDGKSEVDFVYAHPTHPVAIEVASSGRHHRRGLDALVERHPQFDGATYLTAPNQSWRPARPGEHGQIDLDHLLLTIGLQAEATQNRTLPTGSESQRLLF